MVSQLITAWSTNNETQTSGNIKYAPFANNEAFFKKYADRMLVINGVDSLTNSHSIGETVNWSGRTALGYPTLTAMYSAALRAQSDPCPMSPSAALTALKTSCGRRSSVGL